MPWNGIPTLDELPIRPEIGTKLLLVVPYHHRHNTGLDKIGELAELSRWYETTVNVWYKGGEVKGCFARRFIVVPKEADPEVFSKWIQLTMGGTEYGNSQE